MSLRPLRPLRLVVRRRRSRLQRLSTAEHAEHAEPQMVSEWFGQAGLAWEVRGYFNPEFRAGVDWWVNSRRAVRVAVHQVYTADALNLVAVNVGLVVR